MKRASKCSRRQFAKRAAVLAAAPVLVETQAQGQGNQPETAQRAALALTELARVRYGDYLSPDELRQVALAIERGQQSAAVLRQVKLANGDEPAFLFDPEVP